MRWCYVENGQQQGPVSQEELHALARQGVIQPSTYVWTDGMPDWVTYEQAMGAAQMQSVASAPIPVGQQDVLPTEGAVNGTGGQTSNAELRKRASIAMAGNAKSAMLAVFVFGLVITVAGVIPLVGPLLIGGPLLLGMSAYMLLLSRRQPSSVSTVFGGFSHFVPAMLLYLLTIALTFAALMVLYAPFTALSFLIMPMADPETLESPAMGIVFGVMGLLWMLLVMGVIYYLQARFSMAFFSLVDVADGAIEALKFGWTMTKGKSFKLFRFYMYYMVMTIGLMILCGIVVAVLGMINETIAAFSILMVFPCLIVGVLYIIASLYVGLGCFYDDLKEA
ncbi:DUF975 family protein [Cerasicoccus fimbriatus]|uniref:DUF975 family protein n=1 Tax=Cerasicoccus fimbriatus TaxID=3014554 RepID=UPI0022B36F5E|nr:DUF975 family protein [Cerasicoccus sp. TK19100]